MTDDLDVLRAIGRDLERTVHPVGFDTLIAAAARRRRRRRTTVAAAAVAAVAAGTAYATLGMPRTDRALIPASPAETVATASATATSGTAAPGRAAPTGPVAATAPVSVRADAAIASAATLRGIWGAGNGLVFQAFASCPTDGCDSAWRVIDASGRMVGRGILTTTGVFNRVIPHATGFVVIDGSDAGFSVGSDGVAHPLPALTAPAQGFGPQPGDVLLTASSTPELFRPSTGQRWDLLAASGGHEPVPGGSVWALAAIDPTGRIWVPTMSAGRTTVHSSTDGGRTYVEAGFTGAQLGNLVTSGTATLVMYQGDTMRSITGSQVVTTGKPVTGPLPKGVELIGLTVTSSGRLVAHVGDYDTHRQSLLISVDTAWSAMAPLATWPAPQTSVSPYQFGSDQIAAAGTTLWSVSSLDTLHRSTDNGATWTAVAAR